MGDRANVVVEQYPYLEPEKIGEIFLYTHWGGSSLPEKLQSALRRGVGRWREDHYMSRIIFCEMLGDAEELKEITGFGISTFLCDNNHDLLVVDCRKEVVRRETEGRTVKTSWSFADFISLDIKEAFKDW